MSLKRRLKAGVALTLLIALLTPTIAQAWHESTITLPRNGWWYTIARQASGSQQQTRVTNPTYDVVANIARGAVNTNLASNQTHLSGFTTTRTHNSGSMSGDNIRGAFRSSMVNQFTNQVDLAWRP